MERPGIAAFFDFDNTLLNGESAALGIRYLWDEGFCPIVYTAKVVFANQLYKRDLLSMETMSLACLSYYKGRPLKQFQTGSKKFYDTYLEPAFSARVLDRLEHHRQEGHLLVLLSGSIDYYLSHVKEGLRFDQMLCSSLEVDQNGICTGKTNGPMLVGDEKKRVAEKFAEQFNIDLAQSFSYADHQSDIALMETVGHAVAVNPTEKLKEMARQKSWQIL